MEPIPIFTQRQANRVWQATLDVERMRGDTPRRIIPNEPEPVLVRNVSGHEIPAYGLMQPSTTYDATGSYNYIDVVRAYDPAKLTSCVLVNGPFAIPDDEYGTAQPGPVFRVLLDSGITPLIGDRVGWKANSFEAAFGCLFSVIGVDDIDANIVRCVFDQSPVLAKTTSGGIPSNGSGAIILERADVSGWTTTSRSHIGWTKGSAITGINDVIAFPINGRWLVLRIC